jgi:hypothetical protein
MPQVEPFSPHLFVGRNLELEQLITWATDPTVTRRLISIAAPPSYGKSWLLSEFKRRLSASPDHFVIHVLAEDLNSRTAQTAWIRTILKDAQAVCAEMRPGKQDDTLENMITHLLEDLCENCSPPCRPVLIVDDLDEPSPNQRGELEKYVLEQFWRKPCARLVVSFRDEFSLKNHNLRRGETRLLLEPFSEEESSQQLTKRPEVLLADFTTSLDELHNMVIPYAFNIPGLNTVLVKRIKENEQNNRTSLLSTEDLRRCWRELIGDEIEQRPQPREVLEQDLRKVARSVPDTWDLETLAEICGYNEVVALAHIDSLMQLGLVSQAGRGSYQVVAGWKELFLAESRLGQIGSSSGHSASQDNKLMEEK